MFGEMLGVWLTTAFKNYDGLKNNDENRADIKIEEKEKAQAGVNLIRDGTIETK